MLILFARDATDRRVGGFTVPASWLQAVLPLAILLIAPVLAVLWIRLDDQAGPVQRFAVALLLGGGGFLVMTLVALWAGTGARPAVWWLLPVFFLVGCGEAIIAPCALSIAAEVAGPAYRGRAIGLTWLFSALGAGVGSQLVHLDTAFGPAAYYGATGGAACLAGVLLAAGSRRLGARLLGL
jgi:proton-dependent oligopeptide transporter, POT family